MKLPFVKRKKNTGIELILALDVGTEFVKAVLFTVDKPDHKIYIKGYGKSRQHPNAMYGAMVINIEHVVNACDHAIGEALQNSDKNMSKEMGEDFITPAPEKAIFGIAGELVKGVTIMADYEREDVEEKITEEEINDVIESIKEQSFEQAVKDIGEEIGVDYRRLEEINSKINKGYIDGLAIDYPLGMTGEKISYKVFSTFAPALHLNALKEVASQLGLQLLSIEVQPYAVSRALKKSRDTSFSSIIIDIGGGTTDIAVIDKGAIVATKMFAFGGRVFSKRIAKKLNLDIEEAEATKIKYTNSKLEEKKSRAIRNMYEKDKIVWAQGVELALAEIDDIETYPTDIFICGGGSALPEIKEALMEYPWLQLLPFARYPRTDFLYPKQLVDIVDDFSLIVKPEDITPVALARMILEIE